jgi:hypothetical protein
MLNSNRGSEFADLCFMDPLSRMTEIINSAFRDWGQPWDQSSAQEK